MFVRFGFNFSVSTTTGFWSLVFRWRKGAEKTKRFLRQEGEKSMVRVETELPLMGPDGLKPD